MKRVSVLGGMVTYLKETYKEKLKQGGLEYIKHDEKTQNIIISLIEKVKLNENRTLLDKRFIENINRIKENKSGVVILACTEFALFRDLNVGMPMVDSSYALAEYTVQVALGHRPIPLDTKRIYEFWKERAQMLIEGKVSCYQSTLLTCDTKSAEERELIEKKKLLEIIKRYNGYFKGKAVEFGCGIGRLTELLSKYFDHIDAADYCKEFIDIAKENARKKNISNISYFASSMDDFNLNKKYDFVFTAGFIIFLDEKQFSRLVKKIVNDLKPGGICLMRESMGYSKHLELHGFYSKVINRDYYAIYRTSDEIVNKFDKYGFILRHDEITLPPTVEKPETCQKIIVLERQ